MSEIKLSGYESTWGCSYCRCFNHMKRNKCFNCGADKESAAWVVNEHGYIIPGGG
jgi:formate dehydrogenase maturation protein FdhE